MSRTNRRHNRQIERHRRNDGPALLRKVADTRMKEKAMELVDGLCAAIIAKGSAEAGNLLLELAESAEWANNPAARERLLSYAERWKHEPQVSPADDAPQLACPPPRLALTAGTPPVGDESVEDVGGTGSPVQAPDSKLGPNDDIQEGDYKMMPDARPPGMRAGS